MFIAHKMLCCRWNLNKITQSVCLYHTILGDFKNHSLTSDPVREDK